jgi:hypothetical protein
VGVEAVRAEVVVEEEEEEGVCDAFGGVGDGAGEETGYAVAGVDFLGGVQDAVVGVFGGGGGGGGLLDALDLETFDD